MENSRLIDDLAKKMLDVRYKENCNNRSIFYVLGNKDFLKLVEESLNNKKEVTYLRTSKEINKTALEKITIENGSKLVFVNGIPISFIEMNTIPILYFSDHKEWDYTLPKNTEMYTDIVDGIEFIIIKDEL